MPVHELFPVFLGTLLPAAFQDYKERKVTNLLIMIPFAFSFITLAFLPVIQAIVTFILGSTVWLFFHGAGRRFNIGIADYPLFPAFVWAGGVTGIFVLFVFFGFWLVYDYLLMMLRSFRSAWNPGVSVRVSPSGTRSPSTSCRGISRRRPRRAPRRR